MIIAGTGMVHVIISVPWPCRSMSTPPGQCRAPTHGIAATAHLRLSWRQPLPGACSGTSPLRWPSTPGLGLGWCPHATRGVRSAATAPVLWACGGTAAALYCDWAVLVAAARRPAQPDAADREWRSQVEVAGPCRPRPWPVEPQLQPHTESPSPRGRYVGEASRLVRAVIGNSEGPREQKSIRNYNSNSGTRRRYQLYTCTCRHV